MGLSGASSVLEAVVVGVGPRLSGFGGFPPCGELSSAGPKTATIAEDLPFQRQNDNDSPGRFTSIAKGVAVHLPWWGRSRWAPIAQCRIRLGQVPDSITQNILYVQCLSSSTTVCC